MRSQALIIYIFVASWRHHMKTFSAFTGPFWPGEFPSQRPVTRNFDVLFDLRLNKRVSKQSRRRWFDTPSRSLWCHFYVITSPSWLIINTAPMYPFAKGQLCGKHFHVMTSSWIWTFSRTLWMFGALEMASESTYSASWTPRQAMLSNLYLYLLYRDATNHILAERVRDGRTSALSSPLRITRNIQ